MVRVTSKKKKKTRRLYGLFFLIFLSAAAGVGLYKLSPSLLDIGRIFRHAADKILEDSADTASAESVLRGTVFDRNFSEMAVSYRLYSLYVRPAEITNVKDVVRILADVTGQDEDNLHARLTETKSIINIAGHLEQSQVDMIKNARLAGLYVKPVEERFYPEHETAASLVGFTGKGMGLSGVEGVFDTLLQEGEFRTDNVPGIDFSKEQVLGRKRVDIVLTVDLTVQKHIEKQLKEYLDKTQTSRGIALLMDPRSGAVLAWASQPSYNPNYYWRQSEEQRNSLFEENLDPDLLRRLRVLAAAIQKDGEGGDFLLPETVAVSDYGLTSQDLAEFGHVLLRNRNEKCFLPTCSFHVKNQDERLGTGSEDDAYGPVDWAAAVAGLVNGGKSVSPYILEGVYDHGRDRVYERSTRQEGRERILSPSIGIRVRHEMAKSFTAEKGRILLQSDEIERIRKRGNSSEYVMQKVFFGAIPAKSPEMQLFMVTQQDNLYPLPGKTKSHKVTMKDFGKKLLASLYNDEQKRSSVRQSLAFRVPKTPDKANYNQFLISSKIDFQERRGRGSGRVGIMPQLVGLSLRKGLQHLNEYQLQVKIQGSGQIVSQVPSPGEPLQGVGECVLTLGSEI